MSQDIDWSKVEGYHSFQINERDFPDEFISLLTNKIEVNLLFKIKKNNIEIHILDRGVDDYQEIEENIRTLIKKNDK